MGRKKRKFSLHEPIYLNKKSSCPFCLEGNEGSTGLEAKLPREGDISICLYCSEIAIFGKDLGLLKPSPTQLATFLQDPQVAAVQTAMREFVFRRKVS